LIRVDSLHEYPQRFENTCVKILFGFHGSHRQAKAPASPVNAVDARFAAKQVSNIMSQNTCTLNPGDSIQQAIELMAEKRISCVVIATNGKPVGIITERDITRLFAGSQANYDASVESMMVQPVRN